MTGLRALFERIASAAPPLREWAQSLSDDDTLDSEWNQLAHELVDLAPDDTINALGRIAPILEDALAKHDDRDQVSLGFIETLIRRTEEKRLDPLRVRSTLGPVAREHWDSLSHYLHQRDWSLIHFASRDIGGFVAGPARFEQWLVRPGASVPADASVARLIRAGVQYDLVATLPCRVDRFAVNAGHQLAEDDLLCYVLPDDHREFRRSSPYLAIRTGCFGAAA